MPPVRLVLDSNAYFRLGCSIRPLLAIPFGSAPYRLTVTKDLDTEFLRSNRLQTKFCWVKDSDYCQDRQRSLVVVSKQQRKDIDLTVDYLLHHDALRGSGVSLVDIRVLATASVLSCTAITDDGDMRAAAADLGIQSWTTLELLKCMLGQNRVDMPLVRQIVQYWGFENDLPVRCREDYERLFGEPMPWQTIGPASGIARTEP